MQLLLNETGDVRRESMNGKEFLVAPVTLMKSMRLHRGYVPEKHVKKSAPSWNGTPITLGHPRNASGDLVSANHPDVAENTWLGFVFNAHTRSDDTVYVDGEAWYDIEKCKSMGGQPEQIINKLDSGENISVSSSYHGDPLEPGQYDGEYRDKVRGNLRPDHLATLLNKSGRCSLEDGCSVGMAANADHDDLEFMAVNVLDSARTPTYDGTETSDFSDVTKDLNDTVAGLGLEPEKEGVDEITRVSDLTADQRQQIADLSLLGDPDADTYDGLRVFQVVNHNNMNLNANALEAVLGGPGQRAEIPQDSYDSAASVAERLLREEFPDRVDEEESANAAIVLDGPDRSEATLSRLVDGTIVSWGENNFGVVRDTIDEGIYDGAIDGDKIVKAPAALVEVYELRDGMLRSTGVMDAFQPDELAIRGVMPGADDPDESNVDPMGEDTGDMQVNKSIDGIQFSGTADGSLDESEIPNDDFSSHYVFDGENKSDSSFPLVDGDGNLRRGNVESAFNLRGHSEDVSKLLSVLEEANKEFDSPPIGEEDLADAMSGNSDGLFANIKSFLGWGTDTDNESAESDIETNNMGDKTQELVENHGFDAENLPSEDTECFDRIYNSITEAEDEPEDDGSEDEPTAANDAVTFESEEEFEETISSHVTQAVNEALEERESRNKREQLVDDLVQNGDFDDDDREELMDTPASVLERMRDDISTTTAQTGAGSVNYAAQRGASANASNGSEADEMPALSASERMKEVDN